MLELLRDLVRHKNYADAAVLRAVAEHDAAAADDELRSLLHHMLMANRFWLALFLERPFEVERESQIPGTVPALAAIYRETSELEANWLSGLAEPDLGRTVTTPFLPDRAFSINEGLTQVCLHSQGHRAQCALRLRSLGVTPPTTDFILWLKSRAAPDWPVS